MEFGVADAGIHEQDNRVVFVVLLTFINSRDECRAPNGNGGCVVLSLSAPLSGRVCGEGHFALPQHPLGNVIYFGEDHEQSKEIEYS